jgi:hypothetical protein
MSSSYLEKLFLSKLEMIDISKKEDSILENAKKHLDFAKLSLALKKHQLKLEVVAEAQEETETQEVQEVQEMSIIYSKYIEVMLELVELNLSDL